MADARVFAEETGGKDQIICSVYIEGETIRFVNTWGMKQKEESVIKSRL